MKLTKNLREAFVRAVMADVPKVDYREQLQKAATAAAVNLLPAPVAAAYKQFPDYVVTRHVRIGAQYFCLPSADGNPDFPIGVQQELARLEALREAQEESRKALRTKLNAAANSVTTRKALAELLPEFEKYLPADERTATLNLPAVANIVADFVQAGWPKGQVSA